LPEIKGLKKITYQNYISKYRTFNNYLIKNGADDNDITAISNEMIIGFFLFLINDLKLAHITVSKYEHMLAAIFNWLVEKKHIHKSPVYNIPKTTRENDTAPRPVNEMDIDKLVDEIKKDRQLWLAVQLEYYCFLRPGLEIRMSRVKWFDLARGRIIVPRDLIKSKVDKVVIIPAQLREHLLVDWKLHLFPPDYFVFGSNGMPGTQPIGNNNLRNRFNRVRDSLGLPLEYKLYSWKHTGNARAEDAGIPMAARQRQNGHRSMRSTEEYLKNKIGFHSEELEKEFPSL
jgi:integrase